MHGNSAVRARVIGIIPAKGMDVAIEDQSDDLPLRIEHG